MNEIQEVIRKRRSYRGPFDPKRPVAKEDLQKILDAAAWAPTPHNMQNFEIIAIDDPKQLEAIGRVRSRIPEAFLHESFLQMSFSEEELARKGTGILATMFPPSWRHPYPYPDSPDALSYSFLGLAMKQAPLLLIVTYDSSRHAPDSEGDVLGILGLGCVLENIWLMSESLHLGFQILSVFSSAEVERPVKEILGIPERMKIAFACRIGYPLAQSAEGLRVRRKLGRFVHQNRWSGESMNKPVGEPHS